MVGKHDSFQQTCSSGKESGAALSNGWGKRAILRGLQTGEHRLPTKLLEDEPIPFLWCGKESERPGTDSSA